MISVVVPAYNAGKYLPETVQSILAQTISDWELVIVDDGSEDETAALADGFAAHDERIRVVHQPNGGLPTARNQGYAATSSRSEYVIFLDADDVWEPDALARLLQTLQQQPKAVGAHAMGRYIDSRGRRIKEGKLENAVVNRKAVVEGRVIRWPRGRETTFAVLAINCYIVTAGLVLLRRSALARAGLFDPMASLERASLEDWDLWLRLSLLGDFAVVDDVLLNYRYHEYNLSKQGYLMFLGEIYVRRKSASLPGLSEEQRHILARGSGYWLATHYRRVSSYQERLARQNLRRGRLFDAAAAFGRAASGYHKYLRLRRSGHRLTDIQVNALLNNRSLMNIDRAFFE